VVDGLCAPHGELIVSSPYSWQSTVMEDHERLGGADPAIEVAKILRDGEGREIDVRLVLREAHDATRAAVRGCSLSGSECPHL
jgi:hypothetical protein